MGYKKQKVKKTMKCKNCGKKLKPDMEIEYSEWLTEYFCGPDCATSRYYEYVGSRPLMGEEKEKLFKPISTRMQNHKTLCTKCNGTQREKKNHRCRHCNGIGYEPSTKIGGLVKDEMS